MLRIFHFFSIKHDLARSCFQLWPIIGDDSDKSSKMKINGEVLAETVIFSKFYRPLSRLSWVSSRCEMIQQNVHFPEPPPECLYWIKKKTFVHFGWERGFPCPVSYNLYHLWPFIFIIDKIFHFILLQPIR